MCEETIDWLLTELENNTTRMIGAEKLLLELLEMNPIQRAFSKRKILKHLKQVIENETNN